MDIRNSKKHVNLNGTLKVAALSVAVAFASGCSSPSDPDSGTSQSVTSLSGIAIDGYLAGATVYADLNEDGRLNSGEPSATTDKDGYFSTAMDDTDYCASSETEKFCLQIPGSVPDSVILRTYGGFDVFTGEPFIGELSASVSPESDGSIPDQMITPLSSVLVGAGDDVLGNLGLVAGQHEVDFLGDGFDPEVANRAYLLHKVAVIFANLFEEEYELFGEESYFPQSSTTFIYEAFSNALDSSSTIDRTMLATVFDAVDLKIRTTYDANNDDEPALASSISAGDRTLTLDNAEDILGLVNAAIPESGLSVDEVRARMIGVEMVVTKMINDPRDTGIADALAEAMDTSGAAGTLYEALGDGTDIDFATLLEVDYSALTIDYDQVDVTGGVSFSDLAGQELFVEYSEDDDASGAAVLLFSGEGDSGDLKLCIKYDDGDPEETSSLETTGALFDAGEWSKIDDRRLIITVLGGFDFTLISRGAVDGRNVFSLTYTGETETWDTDLGLSTSSGSMETHEDCQARLTDS